MSSFFSLTYRYFILGKVKKKLLNVLFKILLKIEVLQKKIHLLKLASHKKGNLLYNFSI